MGQRGINKVILVGRLGQDPECRVNPASGSTITKLSVATTDYSKDKKTGNRNEFTEWHKVVAFGRLAEIMREYLKKGSQVYIEGRLQTNKWQDNNGADRYTTEIVANEMQMLGGLAGPTNAQCDTGAPQGVPPLQPHVNQHEQNQSRGNVDFDDDIPF